MNPSNLAAVVEAKRRSPGCERAMPQSRLLLETGRESISVCPRSFLVAKG